jgi:pyridoxine 4-oxidase
MRPSPENWFDFLVIGSGSAGAVLAARLAEDPALEIGLIEAGGPAVHPLIAQPAKWPLLQGSEIDWAYRTISQRHTADRVHDWPRGRVVGGSTAINAMAHVRGHASDFDGWAAEGCCGWGYLDLLPYFIRSETYEPGASPYHGDRGPIHLIRPREDARSGSRRRRTTTARRSPAPASTRSPSRTANARPSRTPI